MAVALATLPAGCHNLLHWLRQPLGNQITKWQRCALTFNCAVGGKLMKYFCDTAPMLQRRTSFITPLFSAHFSIPIPCAADFNKRRTCPLLFDPQLVVPIWFRGKQSSHHIAHFHLLSAPTKRDGLFFKNVWLSFAQNDYRKSITNINLFIIRIASSNFERITDKFNSIHCNSTEKSPSAFSLYV